MGVHIGMVGLGQFGTHFADLFRKHPRVSRISLCDADPDRVAAYAKRDDWRDSPKFDPQRDGYDSLEAIGESDADALVLITQPWLHAPQAAQVMQAGKHVYSAVPVLSTPDGEEILDWCEQLVELRRTTGMRYMLGETTAYRPATMFCRRQFEAGAFGEINYCEGEYFHDVDGNPSLREVYQARTSGSIGREWTERRRQYAQRGLLDGPMHYPTHSISGPLFATGARARKVIACGIPNRNDDPFFQHSAFANELALFELDNGVPFRVAEFRETAGAIGPSETFRILGKAGSWVDDRWQENGRTDPGTAHKLTYRSPTPDEMRDPLPAEVLEAFGLDQVPGDDKAWGGHGGSHPYLVHEFVTSVADDREPAVHVWHACHWMAMGVRAHQSALRDGERLDVPDYGQPPA